MFLFKVIARETLPLASKLPSAFLPAKISASAVKVASTGMLSLSEPFFIVVFRAAHRTRYALGENVITFGVLDFCERIRKADKHFGRSGFYALFCAAFANSVYEIVGSFIRYACATVFRAFMPVFGRVVRLSRFVCMLGMRFVAAASDETDGSKRKNQTQNDCQNLCLFHTSDLLYFYICQCNRCIFNYYSTK